MSAVKCRRRAAQPLSGWPTRSATSSSRATSSSLPSLAAMPLLVIALVATAVVGPAAAVMIPFENCLPSSYRFNDPTPLQFVPLYADAVFDTEHREHNLRFTVWGNVTGSRSRFELPGPDDEHWADDDKPQGKIIRNPEPEREEPKATTLLSQVEVLTYKPWDEATDFCATSLVNATCPLGPVFDTTGLDIPFGLPSINMSHNFYADYAFTSFSATFLIIYGDSQSTNIGCISAPITPDLGELAWMLMFLPLVVLLFVGFATVYAGIFSACGTSDIFYWTSNFGRQADLLRLVTPGFGDCLQYIQFIVLTGSLTLNYPGFFQPITSQVGWSALMFNGSFVSESTSWQSVVDGIYVTNGTYGLQRMGQLVGMANVDNIWAGMMVWLLIIIASVTLLIQLGFLAKYIYRWVMKTPEEDLRAKNIPFSLGNVVRIVLNYFLLPIVALSTFQFVVAGESAAYLVALAVLTMVLIVCFAARLLWLIIRTKPRVNLFDDLQTLLLYGPLYNTYSDEAAPYALIPFLLTFIRGIAIGGVQLSGIAQLVILAICEVIQVLTIHAFRPFHYPTSMNAYHTLFSVVRFTTILLMVAFAPTLGVTEGPKGWIGYAILLLHGSVLVLGFCLNALQKCVEVSAYLLGVGAEGGQGRGPFSRIFGARQLSRRMSRRQGARSRQSQMSAASGMLDAEEAAKAGYVMPGGRIRSESQASLGGLLNNRQRSSSALDSLDMNSPMNRNIDSGASGSFTPGTPGAASTFSFLPSPTGRPPPAAVMQPADPYYRPPRPRRETGTDTSLSDKNRASLISARRYSQAGGPGELAEIEAQLQRATTRAGHGHGHGHTSALFTPRTDYSTREVDFYYGVRGPALKSDGPGRKLGTGPADPTGPMASAASWLRGMFGGKSKEKGKGFEVVRSARMPPAMKLNGGAYHDDTPGEGVPVAMGVLRQPLESDDDEPKGKKSAGHRKQDSTDRAGQNWEAGNAVVTSSPPKPAASTEGNGDDGAAADGASSAGDDDDSQAAPGIPRKSSKRVSINFDGSRPPSFSLMSPLQSSPRSSGQVREPLHQKRPSIADNSSETSRLAFGRSNSQEKVSGGSSVYDNGDFAEVDLSPGEDRPTSYGYVAQHSISRVDPETRRAADMMERSAEIVDERGAKR